MTLKRPFDGATVPHSEPRDAGPLELQVQEVDGWPHTLAASPSCPWPSFPPSVSLHLRVKEETKRARGGSQERRLWNKLHLFRLEALAGSLALLGKGGGRFLLLPLPSETLSLVPPDSRLSWRDSAQSPGEKFSWRGESPAGGLVCRGWTSLHVCTCVHTHSHTGAHQGRGEPGRG